MLKLTAVLDYMQLIKRPQINWETSPPALRLRGPCWKNNIVTTCLNRLLSAVAKISKKKSKQLNGGYISVQ